jgi:hypothetical protein
MLTGSPRGCSLRDQIRGFDALIDFPRPSSLGLGLVAAPFHCMNWRILAGKMEGIRALEPACAGMPAPPTLWAG